MTSLLLISYCLCLYAAMLAVTSAFDQDRSSRLPLITSTQPIADYPDVIHEDDHDDGMPVFVVEPADHYYVIKNRPLTITCAARQVVQINFKCSGQWVSPQSHVTAEVLDPDTGGHMVQASIEVDKDEVDKVTGGLTGGAAASVVGNGHQFQSSLLQQQAGLDGYWCECHAWNSRPEHNQPITAKTRRSYIHSAYLRKRFEREPISSSLQRSSTVQLQCLPPIGLPVPEVFWLKDGEQLDVRKDGNLIISNEGSLIINQARLSDSGNYTCGAQNIASRRLSESALLAVYENGAWSAWSAWSECPGTSLSASPPASATAGTRASPGCVRGHQRRSRACTEPSPVNNGAPCLGDAVQKQPCPSVCSEHDDYEAGLGHSKTDGVWSTWSAWSACSPDCKRYRRRTCDVTSPETSGSSDVDNSHYCHGSDLDTGNCSVTSGDLSCQPYLFGELAGDRIAMFVGLAMAVAFSALLLVMFALVLRRRRRLLKTRYVFFSSDLVKSSPAAINCQLKAAPNNNRLPPPGYNGTRRQPSGSGPSLRLLDERHEPPYSQLDDDSLRRLPVPITSIADGDFIVDDEEDDDDNDDDRTFSGGSKSDGGYSYVVRRTATRRVVDGSNLVDDATLSCPMSPRCSLPLPSNIDSHSVARGRFTSCGGRLELRDCGVSLTVPEGAIQKETVQEVFIAISRDNNDRPKLSDQQTMLSAVLVIGPRRVNFLKPIVVSFHHCASVRHGQWTLALLGSESPVQQPPQWQVLCRLGEENLNTPIYAQIDRNECHVMTQSALRGLTLVGEPTPSIGASSGGGKTFKVLRLAAFGPVSSVSFDFNLRIYVIEDTDDAFQGVLELENSLGGQLIEKPKSFLFLFTTANLCLTIDDICDGWRCKMSGNSQEIPFRHVWSGTQSSLHCSFMLEQLDPSAPALSCRVHVVQKSLPSNQQTIHVTHSQQPPAVENHHTGCPSPSRRLSGHQQPQQTIVSNNGTICIQRTDHVFWIPSRVRTRLCEILDPPNARGNDWRMLAQRLSVNRYINYFATKISPTDCILDLWEARHRDQSAIVDLINSLQVMGRTDAAAIIETELGLNAWL